MSFGTFAIGTIPYGGGSGGSDIVYYSVSLDLPVDADTSNQPKPTFSALPNSSDGSNVTIEWQWDTSMAFNNALSYRQIKITNANVSGAIASTAPDNALRTSTWFWRVRAGDGSANWTPYTLHRSLAVDSPLSYSSAIYSFENVGVAPALPEDTEDGVIYAYENVGVAIASTESTEDGIVYSYEFVQSRPAGSKETLPPTHN